VLKLNQQINSDHLNSAFVSKKATGTQIMLGGLNILGTLYAGNLTLNGTLDAGSNTIKTTGTINAGTFSGSHSGSGASLTSLNASNLSSGTVVDARLSSNVVLLNKAQTFTANNTYSNTANLYFAGGTTYKIDTAGSATFNNVTVANNLTINKTSNWSYLYFPKQTNDPGFIGHYENNNVSEMRFSVSDDPTVDTDFFSFGGNTGAADVINGGTWREGARITAAGNARFYNITGTGLTINGDAEVIGELKAAGGNEFPDPLVASQSTSAWSTRPSTTMEYDIQAPSGTGAAGSIKITSAGTDTGIQSSKNFPVSPGEHITFSAYAFSPTTGVSGYIYILFYNASDALVSTASYPVSSYATGWTRYSTSGPAPSTASYFKVRIDNNVSGGIVYTSAFQVERGRAMTGFKPYGGSSAASFTDRGIMLGNDGEILSAYNNEFIIKDHKNGNVTLSAAGKTGGAYSDLYLGYQNTNAVRLHANLVGSNGTTKIADTAGKLYYQGNDTDGRYVTKGTDSVVTSKIRMEGAGAQLFVANQHNTGANPSIDLAIGDADTGFDWVSDGTLNFMADSNAVATMGKALKFDFKVNPTVNGSTIWHSGNDGSGSGLDADTVDGIQASSLLRSDIADTKLGDITFSRTGEGIKWSMNTDGAGISFKNTSDGDTDSYLLFETYDNGNEYFKFTARSASTTTELLSIKSDQLRYKGNTVFHAGNDGHTSGLDADTLDGAHLSTIMNEKGNVNTVDWNTLTEAGMYYVGQGTMNTALNQPSAYSYGVLQVIKNGSGGITQIYYPHTGSDSNNIHIRTGWNNGGWHAWAKIFTSLTGGSGSGLDADLLDGKHASDFLLVGGKAADSNLLDGIDSSSFLRSNATDTASGALTFTGTMTMTNTLNVRSGTIYTNSNGRVGINQASTTEHPLQVKAAGSSQGINLTANADTDVVGYSIENSAGNANWHIARSGVAAADLVFYGGNTTDVAALTIAQNERVRFYNAGGVLISGNLKNDGRVFIKGSKGFDHSPSIDLAIGDSDTGFNWVSDGKLQLWTNNAAQMTYDSGTTTVHNALYVESNVSLKSGDGLGYRFWNSDNYKIYMSTTGNSTWGGSAPGADSSDYNMYLRMQSGTNRGFVFTGTGGNVAQIDGKGRVTAKSGYHTGNFEIVHNSTEDSLDFVYLG
jgi:hypothetical protein